jgi:formate C-acetyltransferase
MHYKPEPVNNLRLHPRTRKLMDELFDSPKTYSTINAELVKEAYDQHKGEPPILKRAYALAAQFGKMPIYIRENELLIGNRSAGPGVMPRVPDSWNFKESPRSSFDDARYETWDLYSNYFSKLSPDVIKAQNCLLAGFPAGSGDGFGHICADYGMVIRDGAIALAEKAEKQAEVFKSQGKTRERDFCLASGIACRAFADFGKRYSTLAREEAQKCEDEKRKQELLLIADVCSQVPAYGARTFYEAIQAMYLSHMAMLVEQNSGSISIGRFDRILWPFYKNDIEKGFITADFAAELVESFCIKVMENALWPRERVVFANCAIGGCDADGKSAYNDLTWIMLDCAAKTGCPHPQFTFRWHPSVPDDLWLRVVEIIGLGHGLPAIFSDLKIIKVLENWGVPTEIAVEYGIVGCIEPALNGLLHGQTMGAHLNVLLCLELAMNNGRQFITGNQIGPETGYLPDFSGIDDLWASYQKQVAFACEMNRQAVFAVAESQQELFGYPLMSSLMEDAVSLGKDLTYGTRWNYASVSVIGVTNVADSFIILEDLVEKKKKYSFKTFHDALKNNYAGHELLRAEILALDFCFGNQNQGAAQWYDKVCSVHSDIFKNQDAPRGDKFIAGLWATSLHISQGKHTGASVDGRLAKEPMVDSVGPITRRIMHGPLAAAADVAGIDSVKHWPGCYVWNARFSKDLFSDKKSLEKIAHYLSTYFRDGGMQVQINTYSSELLRLAQKDPQKYRDLVVRVAGFSAYFNHLSTDSQDEIISRYELAV